MMSKSLYVNVMLLRVVPLGGVPGQVDVKARLEPVLAHARDKLLQNVPARLAEWAGQDRVVARLGRPEREAARVVGGQADLLCAEAHGGACLEAGNGRKKRQISTMPANFKCGQEEVAPRAYAFQRTSSPTQSKWWKTGRKVPYPLLRVDTRRVEGAGRPRLRLALVRVVLLPPVAPIVEGAD